MNVVITIPAFNEEKDIGRVIDEIIRVMNATKYKPQILVVDDGSKDQTVGIAKSKGAKVVSNSQNRGLAETFKVELLECLKMKADIIVHTDADGQYPAEYIPQLIKKIEEGYDLVLGSRFKRGTYSGSTVKWLGNVMFARVFSKLLKTKITDTTTGFRAFNRKVTALPLINSFTYTQEQLLRAAKNRLRIGEIFIHTNKTRESRLFGNSLAYAFKAWVNILRIYRDYDPLKFFGKIGLSFLLLGGIIGLWLLYLFFTTGTVQGRIALSVFCALSIITGLQIIFFGFLADMNQR